MSNKLIDLSALSEYKTKADLKYQDKLTAGSNISLNNDTISFAPTYVNVFPTSTSQNVANNTIVSLGDITLSPGYYLISYTCRFGYNNSGYRQCGFSVNTTDMTGFGRNWGDSRVYVSTTDNETTTNVSGIFDVSASEYPNGRTFYFLAKQNSGSTIACVPSCYYIKF